MYRLYNTIRHLCCRLRHYIFYCGLKLIQLLPTVLRLCNQHSGEPVSAVQKAIFKKPPSTTNVKQIDGFLPITKSNVVDGNVGQKIVHPTYNGTILTTVSNVRASPSLTTTPKVNGIDVSDNAKFTHLTDVSHQHKNQQVRLVKKVGKTITVSRRPVTSKLSEPSSSKVDPASAVTSATGYMQSPLNKTMKATLKTNTRGHPAPYNIPYYKKLEPVTVSSQVMESRIAQSSSAPTSYSPGVQTSTFAVCYLGICHN